MKTQGTSCTWQNVMVDLPFYWTSNMFQISLGKGIHRIWLHMKTGNLFRTLFKAYSRAKLDMPNPPDQSSSSRMKLDMPNPPDQSSSHGKNMPSRTKLEMPNPPDPSSRPWQEQAFKDKKLELPNPLILFLCTYHDWLVILLSYSVYSLVVSAQLAQPHVSN